MEKDNKDKKELNKGDIEERKKKEVKFKNNFLTIIEIESYKKFNRSDEDNDEDEEEPALVTNDFANKKLPDSTNNNLSNKKLSFGSRFVSFLSNHIGKTILFLLAAAALGLTWYLIPALALAMQISLAVCFVLFIAFLFADNKKNFLPSPSEIFCGLISSEKDDDSLLKEKEKKEPRQKTGKKSEIGD